MTTRKRNQIVISLPEGDDGQQQKKLFELAARNEKKTLSEWARDALILSASRHWKAVNFT